MNNKATIQASRAVASDVISFYVGRFMLLASGIALIATIIVILLAVIFSGWWSILFIITLPLSLLFVALYFFVRFIANRVAPRKMNKTEMKQTHEFVVEVQNTYVSTQSLKKSPSAIGFAALFGFITGGRKKAVRSVMSPIESSKSLKEKFARLIELFSK